MSSFILRFILSAFWAEMVSRCLRCPVDRFQERQSMYKDSVFVLTLARKSKCFLSYEQIIIVDSIEIFVGENCLFIILMSLIQSCLQKAKLHWHIDQTWTNLIYANTCKKLESLSAIASSDSYAFLMLSNLPRAPWLNGARWAVYHLLMI